MFIICIVNLFLLYTFPIAYFLNGWLWGLEERYIAAKAHAAVEKAIAPVKPPTPLVEAPRYHSEASEVVGLDIIEYHYEFTRTRSKDKE